MSRRTKRRYAHEIYPRWSEYETRALAVEVPYLYAQAIGLEVWGTSCSSQSGEQFIDRTARLVYARERALLADALLQGMGGDEAWEWAESRADDESGELVRDRAEHYGVDYFAIKPYPCGREPEQHAHFTPDTGRVRVVTIVHGKESECPECTEEVSE